jgi:hypothetical protein
MSNGLGKIQTAILIAMATNPSQRWSQVHLQQAVWGKHPSHLNEGDDFKRLYGSKYWSGQRTSYAKNIAPFSGRRRNYEQNFTRALMSLAARGLIQGRTGFYAEVELTDAGRREAEWFTVMRGVEPPKESRE